MTQVKIGVVLASVREKRRGEAFAKWIHDLVAARPDVQVELVDLRDWPLGAYTYGEPPSVAEKSYTDDLAKRWVEKIRGLDAYVIVTPEYNHGYPGHLKNALDHAFTAWWYKPVGFVSYGGTASGARAVEQLRQVAVELRMVPIKGEVNVRLIGFQADGLATDPYYTRVSTGLVDQLLWWARATKHAREAAPPPA